MNIVFFGASQLGFDCCQTILQAGYDVKGIFTIPKEFNIKYKGHKTEKVKNVLHADFNSLGTAFDIPVFSINQDIKEYFDAFEALKPDFVLVVGWYYMIPKKFCDVATKGVAGIHASLLPKYRGNAPLVWAMINGEKETGVSLFYFDDDVDAGDLLGQKSFSIEASDTITEILGKTADASKKLLLDVLPRVEDDTVNRVVQDHSKASVFPKRTPNDGEINWDWDAQKIRNFIRAQTRPYPGAFTYENGKKVIIWDADIVDTAVSQVPEA